MSKQEYMLPQRQYILLKPHDLKILDMEFEKMFRGRELEMSCKSRDFVKFVQAMEVKPATNLQDQNLQDHYNQVKSHQRFGDWRYHQKEDQIIIPISRQGNLVSVKLYHKHYRLEELSNLDKFINIFCQNLFGPNKIELHKNANEWIFNVTLPSEDVSDQVIRHEFINPDQITLRPWSESTKEFIPIDTKVLMEVAQKYFDSKNISSKLGVKIMSSIFSMYDDMTQIPVTCNQGIYTISFGKGTNAEVVRCLKDAFAEIFSECGFDRCTGKASLAGGYVTLTNPEKAKAFLGLKNSEPEAESEIAPQQLSEAAPQEKKLDGTKEEKSDAPHDVKVSTEDGALGPVSSDHSSDVSQLGGNSGHFEGDL